MNHHPGHVFETVRKVHLFGRAEAAIVGDAVVPSHRAMNDVVADNFTDATAQNAGRFIDRGDTANQRVSRNARRRDHIRPVRERAFNEVGLADGFTEHRQSLIAQSSRSIDDPREHAGERSGATAVVVERSGNCDAHDGGMTQTTDDARSRSAGSRRTIGRRLRRVDGAAVSSHAAATDDL